MKLLILLLVPSLCLSQPKNANVIKITGIGFNEIAQALVDEGFFFEKIDSNYKTLRTEVTKKNGYNVRYEVRVKDSTAILTGHWISSNTYFDIQNIKFMTYKQTWQAMNEFALSFKRPVEYEIKKP